MTNEAGSGSDGGNPNATKKKNNSDIIATKSTTKPRAKVAKNRLKQTASVVTKIDDPVTKAIVNFKDKTNDEPSRSSKKDEFDIKLLLGEEDLFEEKKFSTTVFADGSVHNLPVLALRDAVFFPKRVAPIFVGRTQSIEAVEKAMASDRKIFLAMEKASSSSEIEETNLYQIGTVASILQKIKLPNGALKILVDIICRADVLSFTSRNPNIQATVAVINKEELETAEIKALSRIILEQLDSYSIAKKLPAELLEKVSSIGSVTEMVDYIASEIPLAPKQKYEILAVLPLMERCEKLLTMLIGETELLTIEKMVQERVKSQIDKNQKEYYLNEQIKAIRKELGDGDGIHEAVEKYEEALRTRNFPKHVAERIRDDIKKLKTSNSMSSEATRSYVDLIISLPWGKVADNNGVSIEDGIRVLNESHYGLDKVKSTVLEYIAVQSKKEKPSGAILCLYGAPGVGKTKMVKSIAKATGRPYEKISLGGIRDEAEIRGHRKTYVAAMPGKIMQAIKRSGVDNPVILLDEIDKMAADYRGDPESALLEALDPEQNNAFQDHYVDLEYDLSKVLFIATANDIKRSQRPLVDRLELIHVPSYLERERLAICKNYILPKALEENCIPQQKLEITDEAILLIIKRYTKESGVRELGRVVNKICRKALVRLMLEDQQITGQKENANSELEASLAEIKKISLSEDGSIKITPETLQSFLGAHIYSDEEKEMGDKVAVTNGLAYTEVGGELLMIEAVLVPGGKGEVKITGKLGDVMKESIQASSSYVKSRAAELGLLNSNLLKTYDIHIHFPAGAIPKDGPSAGIAICTTIVSLLRGIPVKSTVAMTGEMSLRGKVLPIGGLREKLVAAIRYGIKTVLVPNQNMRDLDEIPDYVKNELQIIPCGTIDEALNIALQKTPFVEYVTIDNNATKQNSVAEVAESEVSLH